MAHVLNLAVQCGLKEIGNDESYSYSEDDDKHIEGLEAISQKPFNEILDKRRPPGPQFHTVSCQNKVQTYQFDENISNWGV